jgi:hypothetical protein
MLEAIRTGLYKRFNFLWAVEGCMTGCSHVVHDPYFVDYFGELFLVVCVELTNYSDPHLIAISDTVGNYCNTELSEKFNHKRMSLFVLFKASLNPVSTTTPGNKVVVPPWWLKIPQSEFFR